MFNLLTFHIFGALFLFVYMAYSLFSKKYRRNALITALTGALQITTGTILSIQAQSTLLDYCTRIGLYLALIVFVETTLYIKIKKVERRKGFEPSTFTLEG
jgi:hypothetical protein